MSRSWAAEIKSTSNQPDVHLSEYRKHIAGVLPARAAASQHEWLSKWPGQKIFQVCRTPRLKASFGLTAVNAGGLLLIDPTMSLLHFLRDKMKLLAPTACGGVNAGPVP